jgi:hypothetical protein
VRLEHLGLDKECSVLSRIGGTFIRTTLRSHKISSSLENPGILSLLWLVATKFVARKVVQFCGYLLFLRMMRTSSGHNWVLPGCSWCTCSLCANVRPNFLIISALGASVVAINRRAKGVLSIA